MRLFAAGKASVRIGFLGHANNLLSFRIQRLQIEVIGERIHPTPSDGLATMIENIGIDIGSIGPNNRSMLKIDRYGAKNCRVAVDRLENRPMQVDFQVISRRAVRKMQTNLIALQGLDAFNTNHFLHHRPPFNRDAVYGAVAGSPGGLLHDQHVVAEILLRFLDRPATVVQLDIGLGRVPPGYLQQPLVKPLAVGPVDFAHRLGHFAEVAEEDAPPLPLVLHPFAAAEEHAQLAAHRLQASRSSFWISG